MNDEHAGAMIDTRLGQDRQYPIEHPNIMKKIIISGSISAQESIVQIDNEGPFQINYVNPADDPRGATK